MKLQGFDACACCLANAFVGMSSFSKVLALCWEEVDRPSEYFEIGRKEDSFKICICWACIFAAGRTCQENSTPYYVKSYVIRNKANLENTVDSLCGATLGKEVGHFDHHVGWIVLGNELDAGVATKFGDNDGGEGS